MFLGLLLGVLFVTPLVVVYVLFIRWCDRFEPEPWWLLIAAFIWGAVFSTLGGGISSSVVHSLTADLTGADPTGQGMEAFGSTVLAPVFEEAFKAVGLLLIALVSVLGLHELDGPLDGAIYGGVIGLGFTLTEDVLYVANQFAESGFGGFVALFFLRTVLLGLSHCTFTAMTGLGVGMALESKSLGVRVLAPIVGLGLAMAMHAFHNGLPTFFGGGGVVVMMIASWGIDVLFFALLALLVVRDRAIVIRELASEIGGLVHPQELALVTTYITIGARNITVLFTRGWRPFRLRRHKQLALVELAFIKSRRRRGQTGASLDAKEARLRREIHAANQAGIWLG
jgi:RsiW-degrading membrane proteinase PrsW (M82 family)